MILLECLAKQYPTAKKTTLREMVREGRVRINGQRAGSVKQEVREADRVEVVGRTEPSKASIAPLQIIHEDADILIVHKPAGLLTSTTPREPRKTAIAVIRTYLAGREPKARAGIIHRLDREASGLLVFSKNNEAFENLKRQFFHHSVTRIYSAVVHGHPGEKSGRLESYLVEYADGTVHSTTNQIKGQVAVTMYEVIAERNDPPRSLLRVKLETGRKHQIRVHLARMGHAVVGDEVYGKRDEPRRVGTAHRPISTHEQPGGQCPPCGVFLMLCATILELDHPRTGQRMRFEIPLPEEMRALIQSDPSRK